MSETQQTTQGTEPTTTTTEAPLTNSPEARTEDGTLKEPSQTTTEPKKEPASSTEPKKDEGKKEEPAKSGVPEKYEFKPPEGFEVDAKAIEEITPILKDAGISQETAQKLFDFYAKQSQSAAQAPIDFFQQMRKDWRAEIAADPVLKNEQEVKQTIGRALDGLNNPELVGKFKEAMDFTGAGDNPAFVRAFYDLAKQVTEGQHVTGKGPSPHGQKSPGQGAPTIAKAMFPNLK